MKIYFEIHQGERRPAGSTLSGDLVITCSENEKVKATNILLWFGGKEYSHVECTQNRKIYSYKKQKHQICRLNQEVPLEWQERMERDGGICAGAHKIPFCFELPRKLPSSIDVRGAPKDAFANPEDVKCCITYYLRAEFPGSSYFGTHKSKHSIRKEIRVVAAPEHIRTVPSFLKPRTERLSHARNWDLERKIHGEITYGANIDDTQLLPDQRVRVRLGILNSGYRDLIHSVKIQIVQRTTWRVQGERNEKTSVVVSKSFPVPQELNEKIGKEEFRRALHQPDRTRSNHAKILEQILGTDTRLTCVLPPIPSWVLNTYNGKLIKVCHELNLQVVLSSTKSKMRPSTIPLKIARHGQGLTPTTAVATATPVGPFAASTGATGVLSIGVVAVEDGEEGEDVPCVSVRLIAADVLTPATLVAPVAEVTLDAANRLDDGEDVDMADSLEHLYVDC